MARKIVTAPAGCQLNFGKKNWKSPGNSCIPFRIPMKGGRAFTLMELLLVICVIAILAGLLLPVWGRTSKKTNGVSCLGNLRQWGLATHLFTIENQGFLPKDGTPNGTSTDEGWYVDLPQALGVGTYPEMRWRTNAAVDPGRSLWICPANSRRSNGRNLFHYCLNEHVNATGTGNQIKLSSIRNPVQTIWLFDNGKLAAVAQQNNVHTNLHNRGAQFLFLDGHVARKGNLDYWDFNANRGRTNNPELIWVPK
jgi:prepilin-type processing-associated H-X9-DG protein/prepilin-type N-terminal cleavage/methylation domain-containing protein